MSQQVSNFYSPFEEQVVQQTLDDITERFGKADIGLRDKAIGAGAFDWFNSARLTQEELAEDAARGAPTSRSYFVIKGLKELGVYQQAFRLNNVEV